MVSMVQSEVSRMDVIFDNVAQGWPVTSLMVACAALQIKGHTASYLKIEAWIMSMGYEKRMSNLKVTYVKVVAKQETGGVAQ